MNIFLLIVSFSAGLLVRDIFRFVKQSCDKKEEGPVCCSCCSESPSTMADDKEAQPSSNSDDSVHVFERMKYYFASNDEDQMPKLVVSPAQDLGPQDLA